ncbi:uncharacterized protein LOC132629103 [Lycium barbarum]|uniref:uncharacterized protein LOC132629103 n=1 Tax=Lycium barbarum TaxID=112863 RepID=UPI00293F78BC|nr:uncharacterized protein LOC132629103 [Lycium barbarum]
MPFDRKDVKTAIFQIDSNKSPGPDGYRNGFFKASWKVVGDDITEAFLEFFQNGILLKQLNSTCIALIPEVNYPEYANQFRPISCCNVLYKCISKLICSRLNHAISYLVADNQSAFVQGRSMLQNVLICHDLLRHYNRKTTPRCLVKIDLRKAYDMVSWELLEEVLKSFGFPAKFSQLVMTCVSLPKFSVNVNGENHGYFEGKRGLRQGDPISPLLFVLIMEYLSRVLKCMGSLPDFKFHPMYKQLKLNHLIFADDLMVFCKAELKSVTRVMEALSHFSRASGLVANMDKSNLFMAGIEGKGATTGQDSFWGSVFILPQIVVKAVDKKCREYLWGATEGQKKISLVSWEQVCWPKKSGGLNVKGCKIWNISSVGKLLWQLVEHKASLWVKWVHGIYIKEDADIWVHKAPQDCSWYWKKLNGLKEDMKTWYQHGRYKSTAGGKYSMTHSYIAMLGNLRRLESADLIWTAAAQPKHRYVLWVANQNRILTKDRLLRLNITVEDEHCCLCNTQALETAHHLFVDCSWTQAVSTKLMQWAGVQLHLGGVQQTLARIKRKHWPQFKKEVVAAIWGAVIYHTWRARNWRIFKKINVHREVVLTQIKLEIIERISILQRSRKAHSCRGFLRSLQCN